LTQPARTKNGLTPPEATLKRQFEQAYENANPIFDDFEEHIAECATEWKTSNKYYAPFIVLCQSSCFGKTRALAEFAKKHVSVFMCMRNLKETGFPRRSKICDALLDCLKISPEKGQFAILKLVEAALERVKQIKEENTSSNNEAEIATKFFDGQPWLTSDEDADVDLVKEFLKSDATVNTNYYYFDKCRVG
jgi:hypothetical protein